MADEQPTSERWLPVVGYEGRYEVSDQGRVRSVDRTVPVTGQAPRRLRGQILIPTTASGGRPTVVLSRNETDPNSRRHRRVAHLVLGAFVGPRPDGHVCCHWDDDPANNRLENLRWDTASANRLDSVRNGTHIWAARTHCPRGHEYTPENIYTLPSRPNARYCRECRRLTKNAARDRRVAERRSAS